MNIREQLHKARYGPICNIGGDKKQTTTSATNTYDNRSIVTNTLDGGAITGALGMATQVAGQAVGIASQSIKASTDNAVHAYDYADGIFHGALDFANNNDSRAFNAYDRAAQIENDAMTATKTAYSNATGQLQAAYADAKGTSASQEKIILAVLAVAGIFAVATLNRVRA